MRTGADEGRAKTWQGIVPNRRHLITRVVEIETPPTLCLSRIEGPVKSPLTETDNRYGWSQAYRELGLKGPFFMVRRIGNVIQIFQYEKPPFLPHK